MKQRREAWYRNPFRLGGTGLLVLLTGYGVQVSGAADRDTAALSVLGRLAFLAGLSAVLAAGVIWFLDARAPELPAEEEDATDEDD